MRILLLSTLFLFSTILTFSAEVDLIKAQEVAKTQYTAVKHLASRSSVNATFAYSESFVNTTNVSQKAFYVFNMNQNGGFVIVSGDDKIIPILAYTEQGSFDPNNIPRGVKKLFFEYKRGIAQIVNDNRTTATSAMTIKWNNLSTGVIPVSVSRASGVAPLITTEWSQRPNYNVYCPDGAPTGCVATAVAQVMKYYNHPVQGVGSSSYNHNDYGTLSANYGATTYDWANMPYKLTYSSDTTEKNAISKLMYHIGIGLEMNYSPSSSGASSSDVPALLKNHFNYKNTIQMKSRSSYSLNGWKNLLKTELDAGRVVYHRGYCPDPSAGHAFVVDGYDSTNKFHLNWGWSGSYNGYFEINNLNPGSTYTWNSGQGAIVGIEAGATNIDLKLFSNILVTPAQIDFNNPFSITADIGNYGGGGFNGKIKAALFDSLDNNLGDIQIIDSSIVSLGYNTYVFSTPGMSVTPGTYKVGLYVDLGTNQWTLIDEDAFSNPLDVVITSTNNLGLISNGAILVNPNPVKQNQSFQVEIDVINTSGIAFAGDISVDIHEQNGDWIQEVDHVTRTISGGGTENIVLNHTGVPLSPGTYKFVIWHKPSGGNWEIVQEATYPNSIEIDIVGLDFAVNMPDQYEVNDTLSTAHFFGLNYVSDYAKITTSGADIHLKGDKDYYAVHLDPGYDYVVYGRVYDNYNDGGFGPFTNDLMLNYFDETNWGDAYDDTEMPSQIISNIGVGGKDFYFELRPFYEEDLGNYMLEIEVIRQSATTSIKQQVLDKIRLYPNPANNIVNFEANDLKEMQIITISGREVFKSKNVNSGLNTLNVSDLEAGIYLVNLTTVNGVMTKRLEIIK
jgi:hypothetical protein